MLLTVLYIIAITAEAMTGALSAGRRSMDLFGVVLIACVTALGGGSVRDMLLGHYPLTWVRHPEYLALTAVAALVTVFIAPLMRHLRSLFLVLDAVGLVAFTLIGCQVSLEMGHSLLIAAISGVITGVFGGILRDILCNDVVGGWFFWRGGVGGVGWLEARRGAGLGVFDRLAYANRRMVWIARFQPDSEYLLALDRAGMRSQ